MSGMAKRFRYRAAPRIDAKDPYPSAPRIPILLKGNNGSIETLGIIDSGATETSVPGWVAEILGLKRKGEIPIKFPDGMGRGHESSVMISIEMEHGKAVEFSVPCIILEKGEEVILGRAGFFSRFEITFRESRKEVVLKQVGLERE